LPRTQRFEHRQPIHAGQVDIEQKDIRMVALHQR
jgi:hypothetical protein